jgi:hypothetical protein
VVHIRATARQWIDVMIPSDALYAFIPLTNSVGNVLLKLSITERKRDNFFQFMVMQALGYSGLIGVMALTYVFLINHDASQLVLIFSLNYLATLYVSRWYFNDVYTLRDVRYDLLMVFGIVIFYFGR